MNPTTEDESKFKIEIEEGPWFVVYRKERTWLLRRWERMTSFKTKAEALLFVHSAYRYPEFY